MQGCIPWFKNTVFSPPPAHDQTPPNIFDIFTVAAKPGCLPWYSFVIVKPVILKVDFPIPCKPGIIRIPVPLGQIGYGKAEFEPQDRGLVEMIVHTGKGVEAEKMATNVVKRICQAWPGIRLEDELVPQGVPEDVGRDWKVEIPNSLQVHEHQFRVRAPGKILYGTEFGETGHFKVGGIIVLYNRYFAAQMPWRGGEQRYTKR